jgi:hypothetical protein
VEDTAELLHTTVKRVNEIHDRNSFSYIGWDRPRIHRNLRDFIVKEKRWPRNKDWRRSNDLPSIHSVKEHFGGSAWGFVSNQAAFESLQHSFARLPRLTALEAVLIPNATHRAHAMRNIDLAEVVKSGAAELVKRDKFGKLWRIKMPTGQDDIVVVEVINATKEPDGTFARYHLRVPPHMVAPRQAVAWSFGIERNWHNFKIEVAT